MRIIDFLKKTVDGTLSLEEQKQYLLQKPFGDAEEIAEAIRYLYQQMPEVPSLPGAIDVCGTGGSGMPRPNVSTISAFITAATGVKTAKHGNNAASGKFGSFDLLGVLDIPISLSTQQLQMRFHEYNLAFLYAKNFHPAMRFFAPVRAEIKQPTFFNILGPLLSPVKAGRQLIGVPKAEYARTIADVAKILGKKRVVVATGSDGLDEITLNGSTHIVELKDGIIREYDITPADFGVLPIKDFSEISSEGPEDNVSIAELIIDNKDPTRRSDLVLINSAMALYVAGKSDDLKQCYLIAKEALVSGKAREILDNYRRPDVLSNIAARDAERDFTVADKSEHKIRKYSGGLIAEIKRKSPSEGEIKADINIATQARTYELAGASAISVLCEPADFGGSFEDLKTVREAVDLPVLCKDFVLREEHIDKAKSCGADMILLIAAILDEAKLKRLHDYASGLGLQSIVEVHTKGELEKALALKPEIIGVNSRNLHDFSLDAQIFDRLLSEIPNGTIKIAESGISDYKDVPSGYDGILVGTVLMRHPFPGLKIKELSGRPLLKLCGIRGVDDAKLCEQLGVDIIGINFVPRSKRKVSVEEGRLIASACKNTIPVGIFEDQDSDEVNKIAEQTRIKAVQLSGIETGLEEYDLPVIKTLRLGQAKPEGAFMTILDGPVAGSGEKIDYGRLEEFAPHLIAGGVDISTAEKMLKVKKPLGIDTASGIESDGKVDPEKIKAMHGLVSSAGYGV